MYRARGVARTIEAAGAEWTAILYARRAAGVGGVLNAQWGPARIGEALFRDGCPQVPTSSPPFPIVAVGDARRAGVVHLGGALPALWLR